MDWKGIGDTMTARRSHVWFGSSAVLGAFGTYWILSFVQLGDPREELDLGSVKPLQNLRATFSITNRESYSVVLSGFEEACGVRAILDRNPVLAPGESAELTLISYSGRRPGPTGSSFQLGMSWPEVPSFESRTYIVKYDVIAEPWLSKGEIWLAGKDGTGEAELLGTTPGSSVTIKSVPEGVKATLDRLILHVSHQGRARADFRLGDLLITVKDGASAYELGVPVYQSQNASLHTYPPVLRISSRSGTSRLMGVIPSDLRAVCSDRSIQAIIKGEEVRITVMSQPQHLETRHVALRNSAGVELAGVDLLIGGDQ